jgi:hypothetical protein
VFGQLPKLLDRDFIVGYFLPVLTFVAASLGLSARFGGTSIVLPLDQSSILLSTVVLGLASALGGVILLILNRDIIRLMEGYGRLNPARLLAWIEKRRYKKYSSNISKLTLERDSFISKSTEVPQELQTRRNQLIWQIAERFPDREDNLLPTALGNTIRAFEVYPYVMYGIDAIEGWSRLLGVIPKDYREVIDSAKAQTDFWVNLWLLSLLFMIEYIGFALYWGQVKMLWLPPVALGMAFIASAGARTAAVEWGSLVKASFDIFLPQLRTKLEFPFPANASEERQQWNNFSKAFLYRQPSNVADRDQLQQQVNAAQTQPQGQLQD